MSKKSNKDLQDKISAAIHRIDPIGLHPCPVDEYDFEAQLIIKRIENGEKLTEDLVYDVFLYAFGKHVAGDKYYYKYGEIFKEINKIVEN